MADPKETPMTAPNATTEDLELMLNPDRWPNYIPEVKQGILPLKHPDAFGDKEHAGFGVLMARWTTDGWFFVWEWKVSLWDLGGRTPEIKNVASGMQELIRLLVQCGWVVD